MCKVLSINKQSLPVDSNPVSMPALHYNKALIAFPEGSAEKFALQLARKLSLNLCHLECVAASDCDFEKQEIQIDKVG
ncbi:MAG TPA: hypothetical protein VM577_10565, partial [Anaerovoracaceae bacterium]|nr:hypothetical protein [Anaerovoracaceae bacterium]